MKSQVIQEHHPTSRSIVNLPKWNLVKFKFTQAL
jgi:hypothetical protein